jgi:hypothetical protein
MVTQQENSIDPENLLLKNHSKSIFLEKENKNKSYQEYLQNLFK